LFVGEWNKWRLLLLLLLRRVSSIEKHFFAQSLSEL
jgi:hypothetical protein